MHTSTALFAATTTLVFFAASTNAANAPQCRPLGEIYADGQELCDEMWGEAFTYIPVSNTTAYDLAYTMWWLTGDNPNDATTARRIASSLHDPEYNNTDVCHLQSGHKSSPGPEPDTFTECHPWKDNACCTDDASYSAKVLKELYGAKYRWDKCGTLSQECERFFVMEACFYQCDANAGLFRYTPPGEYDPLKDDGFEHTEWRMKGMPIKGDFCDSWMTACRHDMFCADETQDFFTCPLVQVPDTKKKERFLGLGHAGYLVVLALVCGIGTAIILLAIKFCLILSENVWSDRITNRQYRKAMEKRALDLTDRRSLEQNKNDREFYNDPQMMFPTETPLEVD